MKNAIILCSGGIDSVTAAFLAKKKSYTKLVFLFFNYGQRNLAQERKSSKFFSSLLKANFLEIKIPEISHISNSMMHSSSKTRKIQKASLKNTKKESKKWYVPCRNILFLSNALALAEFFFIKTKKRYDIFVGFKHEGKEHYPDTSSSFLEDFNLLSKHATEGKFSVLSPLIKMDKEDIILLASKLNIPLAKTYSCYSGKSVHCGSCLACALRKQGFYWSNIKDPTKYANE